MKRSLSLALVLIALFGLASMAPATVVIDDTWADATFTTWNLPYQSPWYWPDTQANSNYIGVASGSLILTNYSSVVTKTTYFWTFFTTNDPALTRTNLPLGTTNIISDSTNLYFGNPVQIPVGQMIKLTLKFEPDGFIMDTAAKGLRFGLMSYDHADSGRPTRNTSNISKSGTNVTGYFVEVPVERTVTNNMFTFRVRTNNVSSADSQDPMGKVNDYLFLGAGPNVANIPGFVLNQQYTLTFSIARYAGSNQVSASITGALAGVDLTNFTRSYVDISGSTYSKFDCFMIRGDSVSPVVDNLILHEFKIETLPIEFHVTTVHRIDEDNIRLIWESVAGQNYQIESKDDLGASSWTALDTVTATSASTTWTNTGASSSTSRYYRVINTP